MYFIPSRSTGLFNIKVRALVILILHLAKPELCAVAWHVFTPFIHIYSIYLFETINIKIYKTKYHKLLKLLEPTFGLLLANFSWHLFADLFWNIMTFFIWYALLNIPTHLLGHLGAGGVRGDQLHLMAGGLAQWPCTLRHAVRLDTALANLKWAIISAFCVKIQK